MTRFQFMGRYKFMFFATVKDLAPVLSLLEAKEKLQYTSMRQVGSNRPQTYLSYADIPHFGEANDPAAVVNPAYLVTLQGTVVQVESTPQKAGGLNFHIDQRLNEDSVILRPGGICGHDILLPGAIATVSESATSLKLYDFMVTPYLARFTKVQEFFLGPEALELWHSGTRLTTAATSPTEFDLKA
jgi:hypothetical protein